MEIPVFAATESNQASASDSENEVKKRCWQQREALPDEPKCVICGRYGEYICDETDDDICSVECKTIILSRLEKSRKPSPCHPQVKLPATDECYYVRDCSNESDSKCLDTHPSELLRRKLNISVKGDLLPPPVMSFSSCGVPQTLLDNLEAAGYEIPTPVQMQAIPAALTGQSLLVSADTGSGKTGSFLIPLVANCVKANLTFSEMKQRPSGMVLAPTREICIQIEAQAKVLGKGMPFKTALIVGGDSMAQQLYRIQQGVSLIVGTPGRLIDLLAKHHEIELDSISIFVLDEVDCMLQRGFHEQVMQIFRALSQPQLLMYSATLSREVEKMANSMAKCLASISVGQLNKPNRAVKQVAIWVESKQKKQKLFDILTSKRHYKPPVLVFVGSRLGADLLSKAITMCTGLKALSIHGEKPMNERREILGSFLVGEVPVVVATGILGRGVDLLNVKQVIVFDMPNSIKEYVHQIGRASRMGVEGSSIVFINEENKKLFPDLVEVLKSSGAGIPAELAYSKYTAGSVSGSSHHQKKRRKIGN